MFRVAESRLQNIFDWIIERNTVDIPVNWILLKNKIN